jgi:hypothetical protein
LTYTIYRLDRLAGRWYLVNSEPEIILMKIKLVIHSMDRPKDVLIKIPLTIVDSMIEMDDDFIIQELVKRTMRIEREKD